MRNFCPNLKECCFRNRDLLFHKIDRANSAIKVLFIDVLQSDRKEKAYTIKILPVLRSRLYGTSAPFYVYTKKFSIIVQILKKLAIKLPRFAEYLGFGESEKKNPTHYWILMEKVKGLTFNQIKEKLEICSLNEQEAISIGEEIGT